MTFPMPFFAPQVDPVSLTYIGNHTDTSDASTYTFSGKSIGTAASDRVVCVAIGSRKNSSADINTVTIGGVSATQIVRAIEVHGGGVEISAIYAASVPTGTTADIVVTFLSGPMLRCAIGVYRMTGAAVSAYATSTDTTLSGGAYSASGSCPAGGAILSSCWTSGSGGSAVAWTNATEDFDIQPETSANALSCAHDNYATSQSLTITATCSGTPANGALAIASWGPA